MNTVHRTVDIINTVKYHVLCTDGKISVSKSIRWVGHVARMEENMSVSTFSQVNLQA